MFETLTGPAIFVHLAAIMYVIAMLIREQLILRLFILAGTGLYIVYYFTIGDVPLWEAIFWSVMIGLTNIYSIIVMSLERTTFNMTDEEKVILGKFSSLNPGQFRKLMKVGQAQDANAETLMTIEGKHSDYLYFLVSGTCRAKRGDVTFDINESCFIGEISMLLNIPATATTLLETGGRYIVWSKEDIEKLQRKNPNIGIALSSIMKLDLAEKVSKSVRVA
ncbi:hypothetical protein ACFQ14_14025 [Pseudahrensia aquimaris]|uniref:Cyclic nucleotide-binding domain-containing protein n=1 Tax=Pseudahrensia aquimaris TaxID=744461 RepID=A0ABW3FHU7_9HYPH